MPDKNNATDKTSQTAPQNFRDDFRDDLLQCLVFMSAHHGHAKSPDAIKAGLAYDENGMGPDLFIEAAGHLGFKTKVSKPKKIKTFDDANFPLVVILKDNHSVVLMRRDGDNVEIYDPAQDAVVTTELDALEAKYDGFAIYVHPKPGFHDPRTKAGTHALENETGNKNLPHWFWSIMADNSGLYARVIVAAIFVNLFGVVGPLFIMNVYDRVIPNSAIETGWVLAIGALTAYVFDLIMRTLRGYFIDLAGRRIDIVASRRIYDQLMNMKLAGKPASSGAFANMLRDFDSVRDFLTSATLTGLVDLPFTLFFLFIIYLIGGPIAFMLFFLILFVIGLGMLLQWPLKILVRQAAQSAEAKHGLLVETIGGLETIKAIGADGRLRARYGAHVGESAALGQKSRFVSALGVNFATFLQMSASVIIVLMGMYLVQDSLITMGGLIACVILGGRAIAPIGQIANLVARYHQASSSLQTLNRVMALPIEHPQGKTFLHRPVLEGKIKFDQIDFVYPGTDRKVLDNVSFEIKSGEKVGIIGRIGSGKSTIARLMLGLYDPEEGAIYADDTDYRQIDPADLRRNVAYIAQDVVLFRGTVRENITLSRPQATEEEILNAAKLSGVHEFVSTHPMGYDAVVGERGEGLSGGQRQAIALARAMLHQPNIMVCDEPTNAMDMQAENAFTAHIGKQVKDKTLILITHRHHLLSLVDRLILMDKGKIVLDGPRDKVIDAISKGQVKVES
jgi:ATP-binding cassette subfamily C protein LapB